MFDEKDRRILTILQENARVTNAEIARQLGMAPSAILERIRKLEAKGAIKRYEARLDNNTVGVGLTAYCFVTVLEPLSQLDGGQALAKLPEVQEVHYIAGEDCYLVKIRVPGTEDLSRLIREKFGAIPGMHRTRTTLVLTTLKETAAVSLDHLVR